MSCKDGFRKLFSNTTTSNSTSRKESSEAAGKESDEDCSNVDNGTPGPRKRVCIVLLTKVQHKIVEGLSLVVLG